MKVGMTLRKVMRTKFINADCPAKSNLSNPF